MSALKETRSFIIRLDRADNANPIFWGGPHGWQANPINAACYMATSVGPVAVRLGVAISGLAAPGYLRAVSKREPFSRGSAFALLVEA